MGEIVWVLRGYMSGMSWKIRCAGREIQYRGDATLSNLYKRRAKLSSALLEVRGANSTVRR